MQVKIVFLNMILILAFSVGDVCGQQSASAKRVQTSAINTPATKKVKRKHLSTISLGVVNARAIDLVVPVYPRTARAIGAYGQVQVRVIIDSDGKVVSADVLKGHLLLRPASVRAALKSTFQPLTINQVPVRVSGIINYNFNPNLWNWLEVGYSLKCESSYYSSKKLVTLLPPDFSDEAQLLDLLDNYSIEGRDEALENVIAMIRGKLLTDQRSAWLFETGLNLAEAKLSCCRISDELTRTRNTFNSLLESAPANTPVALVSKVRRLVFLLEKLHSGSYDQKTEDKINRILVDIEDKMPFIGR